jgi:lysophospholipase L1-like esterase
MTGSSTSPSRGRVRTARWRLAAAALLLGSVTALAAAEVALRVAGVTSSRRRHSRPGDLQADPVVGWTLRPSYRGVQVETTYEVPATTNELGFRSPSWTEAHTARALRVLALGDSCTFGLGVGDEDTYPAQLEGRLLASGQDAAVFNAGVSGYDSAQELETLRRIAPVVRPTVVVIGWLSNDATETFSSVRGVVQVVDGHLVHDLEKYREWREELEHPGSFRSALYGFLRTRWKVHQSRDELRPTWMRAPTPAELDAAQRGLSELLLEVRRLGATPLVVLFPSKDDLFQPTDRTHFDRIVSTCQAASVEVIDVPQRWRAAPPGAPDELFIPKDPVHLTRVGYGEIAAAVAASETLRAASRPRR